MENNTAVKVDTFNCLNKLWQKTCNVLDIIIDAIINSLEFVCSGSATKFIVLIVLALFVSIDFLEHPKTYDMEKEHKVYLLAVGKPYLSFMHILYSFLGFLCLSLLIDSGFMGLIY